MDASSKGSTREFVTRNDSKGIPNNKTGNVFTGSMHMFCGVVGAGVLALPYSVSWLGWVAGPFLVILFYAFSMLSSFLLVSLFEVNDIEHGRYHHLVSHILGSKAAIAASVFQIVNMILTMIAYTITGANSLVAIAQIACEIEGKDLSSSSCFSPSTGGIWKMTLVFGGAELFLSQVRNLEEAWWVSVIGAAGSLIYAFIAMILSLVHAGNREGSVGGRPSTSANKAFNILNALGAIGFAYNLSLLLPEIQDTLKQPPSAIRTMKKVCAIAITGSFFFYFVIAIAGYSALGDQVTEIVLDSFCGPNWAILLAQIAIMLHMLTAYQVFGQAVFNTIESHIKYHKIRRAAKKKDAFVPDTILEEGEEEETEESSQPTSPSQQAGLPITPFEKRKTAEIRPSKKQHHYDTHMLGFEHHQLNPIESRLSSTLSTALTETELSSVMWRLHSAEDKSHKGRQSGLSMFRMYSADTGFANEEVPLNDEGFVLPFQYRLVIRSIYVGLITLFGCIMPFFSAFAGLVGAATYFPLAIYFPFTCYRKVFPVTGMFSKLLWSIYAFTFLVALAATIGSVRTIIVGWSTYQIFGGNDSVSVCVAGS
ncbi:hypothetical protein M9434_004002 [Picochlorum sp. BPE23]|nr:hypothetical protein M9434_004002 [Picochlorum sp. BPE23]